MEYVCGPKWDRRLVYIEPKPNCAIIMSGGIDSFVLWNLLKDECDLDIYNINRADGFDNYKRVEQLTGKKVNVLDELTTSTEGTLKIDLSLMHLISTKDYDEIYTGINEGPPIDYFPEFDIPTRPERKWYVDYSEHIVRTPFLRLYKFHILDLARQERIDLSDTMSCIVSTEKQCGECWQCMEKKWAYNEINR
tara:strand:- start:93 stop:671 length:579 start_codon:yes stop_codon:yes gene_type:complete